jgi:hypothetical protein
MRIHHIRSAACLVALGAGALAAQPAAAAVGDYQTTLKETISTGAAAQSPIISLDAVLASTSGGAPVPTGALIYRVDSGHLAPTAWKSMQVAPAGTRLATFSSVLTGTRPTDMVLQGTGHDAQGSFVRATIGIDKPLSKAVGSSAIPVTLRQTSDAKAITISINLQAPVGKLSALGVDSTVRSATLQLQGTIAYGAALHAITVNPSKPTAMTNMVTAQACGQPACSTLRPTVQRSVASVHLPKQVTLQAPAVLSYGYRYSIGGTGRPGDHIVLSALTSDGSLAASSWAADVRPDGTFEVRATVRSGFDSTKELVRPAEGRYVASAVEGNATVLAIAGNDTHVKLVKPVMHIQRKDSGSKLHFSVRVPGADPNVGVSIRLGTRTIAQGTTNAAGRFSITVASPIDKGNLRAVASVAGAETSISDPISFSTTR